MFANEVFGKDCFETRAVVETEPFPPCSCVVDGIQVVTGCTMGKGNMELRKGDSLAIIFSNSDKKIELKLKSGLMERLRQVSSTEEQEKTAISLSREPVQNLFEVSEQDFI